MKSNKGFTLVELLAVIVIMAILITVAVPSVLVFSNNMKKNMFCNKINTIEKAALLYGEDNYDSIFNSKIASNCVVDSENIQRCQKVSLKALMSKGYLKKEENASTGEKDEIYDPRYNESMKDTEVYVTIKNKRPYATYIYKTKSDAELCDGQLYIEDDKVTTDGEIDYNKDTTTPTCTFSYNVTQSSGWFNNYPTPTVTTSEAGTSGLKFGYSETSTPNYDLGVVQAGKIGKKEVTPILQNTNGKTIYCFVSSLEGKSNVITETVKVDTQKPLFNVINSSDTTYSKNKIINISIQDSLSGLPSTNTIEYAWSTSSTTAPTDVNAWKPKIITATSGTKEVISSTINGSDLTGVYYLWIKGGSIKDLAGNKYATENVHYGPYYFDNEQPACGSAAGASTSWTTGNRTITLSCIDNKSGCEKTTYQETYTTSTKTATVTIKDKAGNTNTCTYNVYVDKSGDECEFEIADQSALIGHSITFTGDCSTDITVTPTNTSSKTVTCNYTNAMGRTTTCSGTYKGVVGNVKTNAEVHYNNLKDAFENTANNGTITVNNNYTDTSAPVLSSKKVTLKLNGKTITKSTSKVKINSGAEIIVDGSGTMTCGNSEIILFHTLGKMTVQNKATLTGATKKAVIKTDGASAHLTVNEASIINAWTEKGTSNGHGNAITAVSSSKVDITNSNALLKSFRNRVVEVTNNATVNFNAGVIENGRNNSNSVYDTARGFVNVDSATFNMNGGSMSNYATDSGAGILVNGDATNGNGVFNLNGGSMYVAYIPEKNCTLCSQHYAEVYITEDKGDVNISTSSKTSLQASIWSEDSNSYIKISDNINVSCRVASPSYCVEAQSSGTIELKSNITVVNGVAASRKCNGNITKNGYKCN